MTPRKSILGLVVLVAVASWLIWRFVLAPANPNDRNVVRVSGNIELIDVEMAFKIPGIVTERPVDEGDIVRAKDMVAKLDTSDLKAEFEMRQAECRVAEAAWEEAEKGSREEEIEAAAAAVGKAAAALKALKTSSIRQQIEVKRATAAFNAAQFEMKRLAAELKRAQELRQLNVQAISKEQYDQQKAAYDVALERWKEAKEQLNLTEEPARREQIEEAEQALAQAEAQKKLVDEGPRAEVKRQARARFDQAKAAVELARIRLQEYAVLRVPVLRVPLESDVKAKHAEPEEYVVLAKHVEPGEYVAAGTPVVTIGKMKSVWLRAYIEEQDLSRVKLGQRARVTTDSYQGNVYEGKVSFISQEAEFTPKNVQTPKERVKLVYRIKIDIDNPQMELKRGMPADAAILLDSPAVGVPATPGTKSE